MELVTEYFTCPYCGGHELDPIGGDRFRCCNCGSIYEKKKLDDYETVFEKFDEALRQHHLSNFLTVWNGAHPRKRLRHAISKKCLNSKRRQMRQSAKRKPNA